MTDLDRYDEDHDPYEWWDDEPTGPPQEEPYCFACIDAGCRECQPTRFQAWYAQQQDRFGRALLGIRRRDQRPVAFDPWAAQPTEPANPPRLRDEPPF